MAEPITPSSDSWYFRFHDLMPFRVREILLVSSPYDAFMLEEDGRLTERIFSSYSELNLSSAPRITHAPNGARAIDLLRTRRFDLVMTMVRLADMDVNAFGRRVKELDPRIPVVLLTFSEVDLHKYTGRVDPHAVDMVFLWTGDSQILVAIVKQIEDRNNALHDTRAASVRVVVVVEDSIRRYSSFLSLLYTELMAQSQSLIAEGVSDLHKMLRMRARPKILLTASFDEAVSCYRRYQDHMLALISDVRLPAGDTMDSEAGYRLARLVREENPDLPILLQSAEPPDEELTEELEAVFLDKNSGDFLRRLRGFMMESLGFGAFIFRLPDRTVVGRARDVYEMEQALQVVPAESLEFHAHRNHFSIWLAARAMFRLAEHLRPQRTDDFEDTEEMRRHLVRVLRLARQQEQEGVITDFSAQRPDTEGQFVRLGSGSIGGKARGIAFANSMLARHELATHFKGLEIRIPRSVVVGTDVFDRFLELNPELEIFREAGGPRRQQRLTQFLAAPLPEEVVWELEVACQDLRGPLAVRSSSLLEDSQFQPFAGIYHTFMLPNSHPSDEVRLRELCRAIKAVYASTFSEDARSYIAGTPYRMEEEKMAVVIQRMVGQRHGDRFYPAISGVAQSLNFYPVGSQEADHGLVIAALGLGHTIVSGGTSLQFAPGAPTYLPQFPTAGSYLRNTQRRFYALDMGTALVDFLAGTEASLKQYGLEEAEQDGTLALVGSVYTQAEDRIRDSLNLAGPRVVTFNNILKWNAIPLAPALERLLALLRRGLGCDVELEFALDQGDWGQMRRGRRGRPSCLYLLQIRPQARRRFSEDVDTANHPRDRVLCHSHQALGHGKIDGIRDLVYVRRRDLDSFTTPSVASQVGQINDKLRGEGTPYLLLGPGRWGTSDSRLGIPVSWSQISGARVIVEVPFEGQVVPPSQGSHFFHNITSLQIGYLTLTDKDGLADGDSVLDHAWLDQQPAAAETPEVRHLRLEQPLEIFIDGRQGHATVLKPADGP